MKRLSLFILLTLLITGYFSMVRAETIAHWRFDDMGDPEIDNPPGTVAAGNALPDSDGRTVWRKAVHDHSGNGNHLTTWEWDWAGFNWSDDVPPDTVPYGGGENNLSIVNTGNWPAMETWSEQSLPTGVDIETISPAEFTIEASFKLNSAGGYHTIVGRDGIEVWTDHPQWAPLYLSVRPAYSVAIEFTDVAGYNHVAESQANVVTTGRWYQLLAVSDGSTLVLYLDNELVAQTNLTASPDTALAVGNGGESWWEPGTWTVGRGMWNGGHTDRVYGYIDEVRISDTAEIPQTYRVPDDHATIQAAINAANNRDTIVVADGTYQGNGNRDLSFQGKILTLISENGSENCIIDCQGSAQHNHRAVFFQDNVPRFAVLEGFTIINGYVSGAGTDGNGGAIYADGCSPSIINCILRNNYAINGGAIYLQDSQSPLEDCVLEQNSAQMGGAVYFENGAPTLTDCTASNNSAAYGGGVYCTDAQPQFQQCSISQNTSSGGGGGIFCAEESALVFSGCVISANTSNLNGGGVSAANGTLNLTSCTVESNLTTQQGGAVSLDSGTLTLEKSMLLGNTSTDDGAGCYLSQSTALMSNSMLNGNMSASVGGAFAAYDCALVLRNCNLIGNRALNGGGAGQISDSSDVQVQNCNLRHNEADLSYGPALAVSTSSTVGITYSNVQGEQAEVHSDGSSTVDWGSGIIDNIFFNFVDAGHWEDNNTPQDTSDDTWVNGCYLLLTGSDCVDSGDNSVIEQETDLAGCARIHNETVDMGPYEFDPNNLQSLVATKITAGAGSTRDAQADRCHVSGTFGATVENFQSADAVSLRVGNMMETISTSAFEEEVDDLIYTCYPPPNGGITAVVLDFSRASFSASGNRLDLTGMTAPTPVALVFGDAYYGYGTASDEGLDDVINKDNSLPLQFRLGYEDYLHVTKVKCVRDNENNIRNLTVKGKITAAHIADLTTTGLTIKWGSEQYVLQDTDFIEKGKNKYVAVRKPSVVDNSRAVAIIDFEKCTFSIILKKTDLTFQTSPVVFGLEFDDFAMSQEVNF